MSENHDDLLLLLINETLNLSRNENKSLSIVSSLWVILFLLILIQKAIKYIVKPYIARIRQQQQEEQQQQQQREEQCLVL